MLVNKKTLYRRSLIFILTVALLTLATNIFLLSLANDISQSVNLLIEKSNEKPIHFIEIPILPDPEMTRAIIDASEKYNVPIMLIIGIANAESGLGTNYYNPATERNSFNYWGIKAFHGTTYCTNSSIRCFKSRQAGAEKIASLLRYHYLDEGFITPEQIVVKYVGSNWSEYHQVWINNVNKYYAK